MSDLDRNSTGRILRSAIQARLKAEANPEQDASQVVSILEVIHKLKEKIHEKDRIISEKTSQLLATRDYLNGIFKALADPVLVIDPDGKLEFVNQAAVDLLERTEDELVGSAASALWADRDHASRFEGARLAEAFREGATERAELLLRTRRGKSIPVAWTSTVLTTEAQPSRLVGIARDVRVQRRLEEEKLRAVQALAASVAHEIRNPLGAILNSVGVLRRDLELSGDDRTLFDIVFQETERISGIVSQFQRFATPAPPQFSAGDLCALVREVVTLAEQDERAESKRILLVTAPELPELTFDGDQIKQVVWNLLSNALDAASEDVAIRIRPGPRGGAEVRVADDGAGIRPEVLARATEPFHTTKAKGSGLGLAISKRIVQDHGGTLRLESVPGEGATVSFTLPHVDR